MANFFRDSALFKNKSKPLFYSQICRLSSNGNLSPFISQNSQISQELDVQSSQELELSLAAESNTLSSIDNELINVKMSTPKEKGKIGYKNRFKDLIQNYDHSDKEDDEQDTEDDNEESSLMSDDSSEITDETSVTKNDKIESSVMDEAQIEADEKDDDIEITDVRKIGYAKKFVEEKENNINNNNENNINNNNDNNIDNNNDNTNGNNENEDVNETDNIIKKLINKDVLFDLNSSKASENSYGESDKASMEYLLNAISLLTKNKRNLEHRLKKGDIIINQLNHKSHKNTEIVNILKLNVKKLQENLKLSMSELKNFKDRLSSTRKIDDEVNMELKSLKENGLKNHETLNVLKDFVIGLKDQLTANQISITQKSTQIHHLKSKLDDVSGRLSEEKINNSNLIKTIEETRNNYESELYKNSVKQQELLEKIINKDDEFKIKWEIFTGSLNDQLKTSDNDSKKILELNSILSENFGVLDKTLKSNRNSYHTMMNDFGKSNVENLNCLKFELIDTASNIDVKSYSRISSLFDEINQYLKKLSTNDEYVNISNKINDLIENIKSKDVLENEFKTKNNELIQEKVAIEKEYHSILENFTKQNHKITEFSIKLELAEELKSKISEENNSLNSELNLVRKDFNTTVDRLKNERQDLIKSFEGKLKTQNELLKHAEEENLKSIGHEKEKTELLITKLNDATFSFDNLKKDYEELQKRLEKSTDIAQSSIMELNDLKSFLDKELKSSKGHKNQINYTNPKFDSFIKEKKDLKLVIENKDKIITEMKTKLDAEETSIKTSKKELIDLKVLTTEKQLKIDLLNKLVKELEYKLDNPTEIQLLRSSTLNKNHLNILNREADKSINKPPIISSESGTLKKKVSKKRKLIDSQDSTKGSQSFKQNKVVAKSQPKFKSKSKPANSTTEIFEIPDIFNEFEAIDKLNPPRLNTIIKK